MYVLIFSEKQFKLRIIKIYDEITERNGFISKTGLLTFLKYPKCKGG